MAEVHVWEENILIKEKLNKYNTRTGVVELVIEDHCISLFRFFDALLASE